MEVAFHFLQMTGATKDIELFEGEEVKRDTVVEGKENIGQLVGMFFFAPATPCKHKCSFCTSQNVYKSLM